MTIDASEVFNEYEDTNSAAEDMDPTYNYYLTDLQWNTIDDDDFLYYWTFTEEMYYSDEFYQNRVAAFKSFADAMAIYATGNTGFYEKVGTLAETEVKSFWPHTGENNEPPTIVEIDIGSTEAELSVELSDVETSALASLYALPSGESVSEIFKSVTAELAASISLGTISVGYTFKQLSPPKLSDSISIFGSEEQEETETIRVSTVASY